METKNLCNYSVYALLNKKTGKSYIGVSKDVQKRFSQHVSKSKYNDWPISKSIQKHGADAFKVIVIFDGISEEEAKARECLLIKLFNTFNSGYNATHGGDGGDTYSKTKKNSGVFKKGMVSINKGKKCTPEHIANLRKAKESEKERPWRRTRIVIIEHEPNYNLEAPSHYFKDAHDASKWVGVKKSSIASACGSGSRLKGYFIRRFEDLKDPDERAFREYVKNYKYVEYEI